MNADGDLLAISLAEGIEKFSKSYETLLSSIEKKKDKLVHGEPPRSPPTSTEKVVKKTSPL